MHQRCQVVHISDDADPLLSSLVVVDCAWFMRTVVAATSEAARSQGAVVDASRLVRFLFTDSYADVGVQMGKLSSAHSLVVHWLLAAFQSLHVCIPFGISPSTGSRLFLFTDQLEVGVPNREVWPDRPEVDERQVTCDVGMWSRGGFRMFGDLLTSLCGEEGRRHLDVLLDPAPVLLALSSSSSSSRYYRRPSCSPTTPYSSPRSTSTVVPTVGQAAGRAAVASLPPEMTSRTTTRTPSRSRRRRTTTFCTRFV